MDFEIAKFFNHLGQGSFIDEISLFISRRLFLVAFFAIIVAGTLIFDKKNGKKVASAMILSVIFYYLLSEILLKTILADLFSGRIRPYLADPKDIFPIGSTIFNDSSFPSSHMAGTVAIVWVLAKYYRKFIIPGIIFILLMAFSRMHNGMHYPTDILAGTIVGIIAGMLAIWADKIIFRKIK